MVPYQRVEGEMMDKNKFSEELMRICPEFSDEGVKIAVEQYSIYKILECAFLFVNIYYRGEAKQKALNELNVLWNKVYRSDE